MKFKAFCLIAIACLFLLGISPFSRVKELSLKTEPDEKGNYIVSKKVENIEYIIGYFPSIYAIAIEIIELKKDLKVICLYDEENDIYQVGFFAAGRTLDIYELGEEEANKIADKVLKIFDTEVNT